MAKRNKLIDQTLGEVTWGLLRDAAEALREEGEFEDHDDGSQSYNGLGATAVDIEEFMARPEVQEFLLGRTNDSLDILLTTAGPESTASPH